VLSIARLTFNDELEAMISKDMVFKFGCGFSGQRKIKIFRFSYFTVAVSPDFSSAF
jgi:hypothetical protein